MFRVYEEDYTHGAFAMRAISPEVTRAKQPPRCTPYVTALQKLLLVCAILITSSGSVWGQDQEEVRSFVNDAVAELTSSPLEISQFKAAQVDAIENLGSIGGVDRYLCWLKNDQGRVGYVAVAGGSNSFHVMAFSATIRSISL